MTLNITEPTVGGSSGSWGTQLNDALTAIVAYVNALEAGEQPADSDLAAIAALTTTTYGRALLTLVDAPAARTALGLGSAATQAATAFDAAGAASTAQATAQTYADTKIAALVGAAPSALDTLKEIDDQLAADEGTAAALAATVAGKMLKGNVVTKTTNYTAALGDIVLADTTSGTFTVTVPAASGGKGRIVVKWVKGATAPTINLTGTDHVNTSTGVQTLTPVLLNQGYQLESDGTSLWAVTADDLPLSLLDARYAAAGGSATASTAAIVSGGVGVIGKGYRIPAGSLDTWRAARDASATTRCEVCGFGDSLIWGQGPAAGSYSFLQRLREKAVAAGFGDGGRGLNAQYDQTVDSYGTEPTPILSRTGFAASNPGSMIPMPGSLVSTAANDTVTYQFKGVEARLWWHRYTAASRFTYSVNGGAAVTVNAGSGEAPAKGAASGAASSIDVIRLTAADGLTSGTNTVAITNLGYSPLTNGTLVGSGPFGTGGTITAGTYYYGYTVGPTAGGETTPTVIGPFTITTGQKFFIQYPAVGAGKTVRLYRGTTNNPTAMGLVASGTTSGSVVEIDDTGGTAPGIAPPTTNTAQDTSSATVVVNIEPLNTAGIVWQNMGVQGSMTDNHFSTVGTDNNAAALAALGLQWGTGSNGLTTGQASETLPTAAQSATDTPTARTAARKIALTIFAFGTNDIQKAEGGANALAAPAAVTAGTGIGSGLTGATYFYKVQRVTDIQFGGGPLSPASTGVAVTTGQQVAVTANTLGAGNYTGQPVFNVYRSTSSGGTYGLVGQIVGSNQTFIDNVATPGPAPALTSNFTPIVNTYGTENALALGLRLARNAGSDSLVVLPSVESLNNSRTLGGVFKAAIQRVADSYSAAWVDFDVVLGPVALRAGLGYGGGSNNPHLLKPAYQAQGDFIWTKMLSL